MHSPSSSRDLISSTRRCRWALRIAHCALLLVIASPHLTATVLLPAGFEEVVDGSQLIVHGRVLDVRPQETAGRRTIESLITLSVAESLKGQPGPTIVFRVPGGRIGRYGRVMMGAPVFVQGDEVVVFLRGRAPMVPMPFGLSQGVYRVVRNDSGQAIVLPPPLMARGVSAERIVRGDPARRPLSIDAFSREVRAVAGRAR